ncbi:putative AP superfamily protein [Solitalea canadensis DSM 3403]|uniref:Putative AP superfamily protein n=2 Tax=Solitalea canadensis TaxID=995 RepID=H8KPG8_SOLCM|nr:putative AP superfamily protein [Solitalea canadensis DSM 3403]
MHFLRRKTNFTLTAILTLGLFSMLCISCHSSPENEPEPKKETPFQNNKKILIIGIDGCRQDVMMSSNTSNIKSLLNNAVYSLDALTLAPSWSGNGWSTLLTGVTHLKHGITGNDFTIQHDFTNYPCFLKRTETYNSAYRTMSIVHWTPINDYIMNGIDVKRNVNTDLEVKNEVVKALSTDNPDILFMQFDDVDHAGHTYGFSSSVPQYVSAINTTDGYIGEILAALRNRPNYANEDWLIIVSPDHGGSGTNHTGENYEDRNIFSIYHNKNFVSNKIEAKTLQSQSTINADVVNYSSEQIYASVSNTAYDFGSNQDFTIECRIKTTGFAGDPAIVSNKDWDSGNNKGFIFAAKGNSWKVNVGDGSNRIDFEGGYPINDGKWHHLAVTFSRTGTMKAYQDGMYLGAVNMSNIGNINSGLPLVIGQDGTLGYSNFVNGQISEVRVWNAALDSATIVNNSGLSVTTTHPNYSKLIGYWKGTNESGSTLVDSSPFARNMTMAGTFNRSNSNATLECYRANQVPHMVDYAYSALTWLGIPISPSWGLDGRSWIPN